MDLLVFKSARTAVHMLGTLRANALTSRTSISPGCWMSSHNEVPLEYKECQFEAADTYAPAFKSILLDVVAADTFPGSSLRGHADETVCFSLYVNGILRTFCLFSAPLCPVTQARGPRRSTSAGFRQRWLLAPLPWGDSRVWLQKIMAGKEHFQGRQLQIGISFASPAQV